METILKNADSILSKYPAGYIQKIHEPILSNGFPHRKVCSGDICYGFGPAGKGMNWGNGLTDKGLLGPENRKDSDEVVEQFIVKGGQPVADQILREAYNNLSDEYKTFQYQPFNMGDRKANCAAFANDAYKEAYRLAKERDLIIFTEKDKASQVASAETNNKTDVKLENFPRFDYYNVPQNMESIPKSPLQGANNKPNQIEINL